MDSKARDRMVVKALKDGDIATVGSALKAVTDASFSFYITSVVTPKSLLETAASVLAERGRVRDPETWVSKILTKAEYVEPELTPIVELAPTAEVKVKKSRRRVYHEMMTELLELGTFTKNELLEVIMEAYPDQKKVSVDTCLIDLRNPKYSAYGTERFVYRNAAGKLMFADAFTQ